ncbi:tyrosine-type recombinase/integrase [Paraburkholderia sp.]|uniref:tyrosine-type recombinase/integrase n=1 Tax=Paraburkholderia sp. TaxID=1926495 RepID=UPI0039E30DB4
MAKVNFTAQRVADHSCPDGKPQAFLWDQKASGLGVRVTRNGARAYIYQGKLDGQTIRVTIGDPKDWAIEKARGEARRLQILIDAGTDPREHAAQQKATREAKRTEAERQMVTFGDAWDVYLAERRPKWSERHYQDHVQHASAGGEPRKRGKGVTVAGPLAQLRPLKLSELTGSNIAAVIESEAAERPTMTALSFRLYRGFVRWANDTDAYRGVIPDDTYQTRKVRDAVPKVEAKAGDVLQREQLQAWFGAVRAIENPVINAYLQALLITGARREEMAALRWTDVDFRWNSLVIRDKVEGVRTIPLTPYLATLLFNLKRINETPPPRKIGSDDEPDWQPSPWVFWSKTAADGKLAEPRLAHNQALAAAGLPHVSLHGLRRSFGTLAEWVECPIGVVAQIQGHKPSAIAEKHYRRRPLDLLRVWHTKIEAWMLGEADIEFEPAKKGEEKLSTAA